MIEYMNLQPAAAGIAFAQLHRPGMRPGLATQGGQRISKALVMGLRRFARDAHAGATPQMDGLTGPATDFQANP